MNWKSVAIISLSIFLGFYLLLSATVFNKPSKNDMLCKEVHITIEKNIIEGFLTAEEVKKMIDAMNLNPVGKPIEQIDTRAIEETLRSKELIESAECYKAQNGNICIKVKERIPVIRVMSNDGDDYYVDNAGNQMRKPDYVCNLIIATGNIDQTFAKNVLAPLGQLIMSDAFWRNQIVQINVLADGTVELVPRVGEHILYLGKPVDTKLKLERLRKFYIYGLNKAGWNKYSRISVEFHNQIICKKKQ